MTNKYRRFSLMPLFIQHDERQISRLTAVQALQHRAPHYCPLLGGHCVAPLPNGWSMDHGSLPFFLLHPSSIRVHTHTHTAAIAKRRSQRRLFLLCLLRRLCLIALCAVSVRHLCCYVTKSCQKIDHDLHRC